MSTVLPVTEGYVPFRGFKTWYKIVGDLDSPRPGTFPVLMLHGGPGAPHDYLESLEVLAVTGRPVIFYDQIGCGNSDHPDDPSMWTEQLFVDELGVVRQELGLDRVHIFGNSWGGMLAMLYALTNPESVMSLTLESSPASIPLWVAEANRLREDLPPEIQQTLLKHEAAGTTSDPEYEEAMKVFYDRHVCRVVPNPDPVQRTFAKIADWPQVYHTMNGPSEFHCIGVIKDFDIRDRLGEITIPTLVTSGRHDECTPMQAEIVKNGIPGAEWVIFEESSHLAHVEEPERYLQVIDEFFTRVEGRTSSC
jgi:L-proline amide hydrolase